MDWYVEMNFQENDWWPKKKKKYLENPVVAFF